MDEHLDKVIQLACDVFQVKPENITLAYRGGFNRWSLTINDETSYTLRDFRHDKRDWVEFTSLDEIIEGLKVFRRYGSYEAYHKSLDG